MKTLIFVFAIMCASTAAFANGASCDNKGGPQTIMSDQHQQGSSGSGSDGIKTTGDK